MKRHDSSPTSRGSRASRKRQRRLPPGVPALLVALMVGLSAPLAAPAAATAGVTSKVRVAVPDFRVEGDRTPALALQLQDGFVLGLVRSGIQVIDPIDVGRKLEGHPELADCDSSPCLKNVGEILAVKYVIRVRVDVAGNGYKMIARLFSTEGATPAALPISTKSRNCDVCTAAEARDYMLKLADAIKPDLDEPVAAVVMAPVVQPPVAPPLTPPLLVAMGGLLSVGIGVALLATLPDCQAPGQPSTCDGNRTRSALAGGLIGAGAVTAGIFTAVTIGRIVPGPGKLTGQPSHALALGMTFAF